MKLSDLFDIQYGINMELNACEITSAKDGINFVSRTGENNGVVAKVKLVENKTPQPAGLITCAGGGSVLSTFVQTEPFYSGRDLYILNPKKEMTLEEKLFYCHCIKMNAYRYQYGRQANRTLKDIELPEAPIWLKKFEIDYSPIDTDIKDKTIRFDTCEWKTFTIEEVLECKTTNALIETNHGNLPYVTRSGLNNGVSDYVSDSSYILNKGNCITIGAEGAIAFYQPNDFVAGVKVYTMRNKNMNEYNALFLCTVLNCELYRYNYGRARILQKIKKEIIRLPVDSVGKPDWNFMEDYIKSLPYSDKI